MTTVICQDGCSTTWAVVTSTQQAHPGEAKAGVWKAAGPSADLATTYTATEVVYSWACLCGRVLSYGQPRLEAVPCTHQAGEAGMCAKALTRALPPSDLYVNARYGGRCECCGHQGFHWVRADRADAALPMCLTQTAKVEPVTS